MKEFFEVILTWNFQKIFYENTNNVWLQFFRYVFVGGIAFVVDWGTLIVMKGGLKINLYIAVAVAFVLGLIANFLLSKIFVFKDKSEKTNAAGEFITYAVIGVIGLGLTEFIMWLLCDKILITYIVSKIIAAAIVLVWNFLARKIILY